MQDKYKTKAQLIAENTELRKQLAALQKSTPRGKKKYQQTDSESTRELEKIGLELALSISEVFEALKKISSGDPSVHIDESSDIELIAKLKHMINMTADNIGEIVDQSHEFAMVLAEHFDVLHKVSTGDLLTRVTGQSNIELLESLKNVTNMMIESIHREISERKLAEESLRKLEALESSVLSTIPHAVVGLHQRKIVFANDAVKDVFGWNHEELIGKTTRVFYRSDSEYEEIGKRFYPVLEKQRTHFDDFFCRHKDGRDILCRVNTAVIGEKLEEKKIVVMYEDITERKRAQDERRLSEKRYRITVDSLADSLHVIDRNFQILLINRKLIEWHKRFGLETNVIGRDIFEVYAFLPSSVREEYHKIFSTGEQVTTEESSIIHGEEIITETQKVPIFEKGEVTKIITIMRDITQHKKADQALRASEEKYRSLVENINIGIYRNSAGSPGCFIQVNPAMVKMFGCDSSEELMKIHPAALYQNPEDRIQFIEKIRQNGFVTDEELRLQKKDGTPISCSVTARVQYAPNGGIKWIDGVMEDITDRRKAEEERCKLEAQLLQAQKMEAIGQLAGGVAHDFNNILTAIIGYGNLLKMQMQESSHNTYLTYILDSAERAAKLTQALLAFSRKQMINPKPVNINEIIRGVESFLSRIIGEDIELVISLIDRDLPIMADSIQIEQVLMNLATNARDTMPEGGTLRISTDITTFDQEFIKKYGYGTPGIYVSMIVEDTGYGMDEKVKSRIFEPFFTTKEAGKGTGLGLAMVYGIIKQHEGYINVYSELGSGTTFKIYLPLIASGKDERKEIATSVLKGGTETVLLAEDDVLVRNLLTEVLDGVGYRVISAVDGEDAIRKYNEHKEEIKLLILDVIMPKKNGKEVYETIKQQRPNIKTLFTSGYSADIIQKKRILEEGLALLLKPIIPDDIVRKVRELLDAKSPREND